MWASINNKLDNIIGLLMNGRPIPAFGRHHGHHDEEIAAQLAELLRLTTAHREGSRSADARILQQLTVMGAKLERLECMSQELLDAVASVTDKVQKIRDAQAANHEETLKVLEALKASPVGSDPDVAKAIEQLTAASASATAAVDVITAETNAMADAIAPPAPAPTPEPTPEPAPETPVDPSAPAGS